MDRKVIVGSISRSPRISFTPMITVSNVRIAQPAWVGSGDFVSVKAATFKVSLWQTMMGHFRPENATLDGVSVQLVRSADKRANWESVDKDRREDEPTPLRLENLTVTNSRVSLRDDRRGLHVAGSVSATQKEGLTFIGQGRFQGSPATLSIHGAAITGRDPASDYPFSARLRSGVLNMDAAGTMAGTLNTRKFSARIAARGDDLHALDKIIEAGLFRSQPINLTAQVRHADRDWFVDKLAGSIGRSRLTGNATILKRDGRTKIDGFVHAATLDFDDLASDEGIARAEAKRARIGPRILPETRINLSKIGKTDGKIRLVADQLLFKRPSVFRSLKGTISLDHRLLRLEDAVAWMQSGSLSGTVQVDHRAGRPKLSTDLTFSGATLSAILGQRGLVEAPVRGRIRLSGTGDTVREALSHADGKAAMVASNGSIRDSYAAVLGQDLGNAIGAQLKKGDAMVPLRCLVAHFRAANGVLTPTPLAIETGMSSGRGVGRIILDGETVALTVAGASANPSGLKIVDPIIIGGTLSVPTFSVAGITNVQTPTTKSILKVVGRSIGAALGLVKDKPVLPVVRPASLNCNAALQTAMAG